MLAPAAAALAPGLVWPLCARVCLLAAVFVRFVPPSRMSRFKQLRQLAVQLASLASPEDVGTHGSQSLLESLSGLVVPIATDERALPASLPRPPSPFAKAAPHRRG